MKRGISTARILGRLVSFLRPHAVLYASGILGIGFANFFINAFIASMLMDLTSGIMNRAGHDLVRTNVLMVGGTLFMVVWVFLSGRSLILSMQNTSNDLRRALFRKYISIPLGEVERRHSGDLLSRSNISLRQVNSLLTGEVQMLTNALFSGVGCAAYMIRLNARMGALGILCGVVPLLTNLPFAKPLRRTGTESEEKKAIFTERVTDLMTGRDTVRHMNLGDFVAARAESASKDVLSAGLKQTRLAATRTLADGATALSAMAYHIYLSYLGIRNPALIPTSMAMLQLSNPVRRLFSSIGGIISNIQSNMGGAERVVQVLDVPDEPERYGRRQGDSETETLLGPGLRDRGLAVAREPAPAILGANLEPVLIVEDLSFAYSEGGDMTLSDISLCLGRGRRTALVGPSGGGKSTLVKVIMGLYPPASGEIVAFGRSLHDTPLEDWRRMFSYVPQDLFLFAGSIYESILGGMEDPGPEKVEEAARLANAHDFIAELPGGYEAALGERGTNLSGGQKQRIAIARALLRDAPILLLDEATASLDTESEALVQEALDRLMADRTTLVIAHRLSTVRNADEILVITEGRVVERGRHDELMLLGGAYKQLVDEGFAGRKQPNA